MHWDPTWHSGWFFGMHLAWWVFWIIVTIAVVAVIARSAGPAGPTSESPLEVLKRRYAEGALTTAEYEERRAQLTGTSVPH